MSCGGAGAGEGDLRGHGQLLFVGEDAGHVGFDIAGGHGVDRDGAGGELAGEGFGEADKAGFGGGVVGLAGLAGFADDGGDVDDAAPAGFEHGLHAGLGEEKGAGEIGGEDVVPVVALHAQGEDVAGDAGVVDEDFDAAEVFDDGLGAGFDGLFAGDVEGKRVGGAADGCDFFGQGGELFNRAGGKGYVNGPGRRGGERWRGRCLARLR